MTQKGLEALLKFKRKFEDAYFDRTTKNQKDYPPLAIVGFEDRPRYHNFILKLINESIEEEK